MKNNHLLSNVKPGHPTHHLLAWCWPPLCAALMLIGAGCQQTAKVATDANPVGTYALASIDGNKVPCTLQHEGHTMTVDSGSFVINPDGTCSSKVVLAGRSSAMEVKATYKREGSKLTMQWTGAGTTVGTIEGDTFTMNNEGMVFVYRK